jgi:uncharacterized protein
MKYNRLLSNVLSKNIKNSAFLFGPRGTGKTSFLKEMFPDALYIDLLEAPIRRELQSNPTRLNALIPPKFNHVVILDEVQRVPELLDEVHRLIESRKIRFILTGSSARKLRQQGVNLLAGRAYLYHMHPLTSTELGDDFHIKKALTTGMLPSVYTFSQPEQYLKSYIDVYLREELIQEGLLKNDNVFVRFLEVASLSQGEVINYSEIAREVRTNQTTISNYFSLLEDMLIAHQIPIFNKRAKRRLLTQSKFYYFDVGVFRSVRPIGPLDTTQEADGPALETLFLQELKAINDYYALNYNIYYWRTHTQLEVDFIIYGEHGLHAFEIKRKENLSKKDFNGLKAFSEDYPEATLHLLYGGNTEYYEGEIHVRPLVKALRHLKEIIEPDHPK